MILVVIALYGGKSTRKISQFKEVLMAETYYSKKVLQKQYPFSIHTGLFP